MPHVTVKLWPGRTEKRKQVLVDKIVRTVMEETEVDESAVSVSIEEVPKEKWVTEVYNPQIKEKQEILYKKPGYTPESLRSHEETD